MRRGTHTIVAKQLMADSVFTIKKPMRLKPEGSTMNALANAKMIADAGYSYRSGIFSFDPQYGNYEMTVIFWREDETATHTFKGFNFGYGGEGPHGMRDFGRLFSVGFDEKKIFGREFIESLPNTGTVTFDLNDLR